MSDSKRDASELTADVSEDVIQAALESVENRAREASKHDAVGGIELESSPSEAGGPDDSEIEAELRDVRAQLDLSVERARETLDRLKDTHERYLRAAADLENYKKRAVREKEEAERYGVQKLLKDLLPVVDNLDRALAHAEASNPLTAGIEATRRIFEDTLARYGVKAFSAVGQPFDPTHHEAMQQVETREAPPGTVVSEMVRGYLLHDRLIRPALVSVATTPSDAPAGAPAAEEAPAPAEKPAVSPKRAGKAS